MSFDEAVVTSGSTRTITTTGRTGGGSVNIIYAQNLATSQTTITYPSTDGQSQTETVPGLVGYASDDDIQQVLNSVILKHSGTVSDGKRDTENMVAYCGAACAPFLLAEGVGFAVCYLLCVTLNDISPN